MTSGVTLCTSGGPTLLHTDRPLECARCRTMHFFWRSLYGQTVCTANCATEVECEWGEHRSMQEVAR